MRVRRVVVVVAIGLLALPALARAMPQLTATGVRFGDHPAYVRVVVDFNGTVPARQVWFGGLTTTMGEVSLVHRVMTPQKTRWAGVGVHVTLSRCDCNQVLHIRTSFARHRFKYLSYAVVTGDRLAIDLWKSAPPGRAANVREDPSGCLRLVSWHVVKGVVTANVTEKGLFENTFRVVVRGKDGTVLGRKTVVHHGYSTTQVPFHANARQAGTLEVVALSAKDGSLACLTQEHVALPAS